MPETTVTLLISSLLFALALIALLGGRAVARRLANLGAELRRADDRLVADTPRLAARIAERRAGLAGLSSKTELALWSLSRFDQRLEATRAGLEARRTGLDQSRARLTAAHAWLERARHTALKLVQIMELRRAILG